MPAVGVGIQATIVAANQAYSSSFSAPYTTQGGAMLVQFSGSAWTSAAGTTLSVSLTMNNTPMGTAKICANNATTHLALIPITVSIVPQAPGAIAFGVSPGQGTTCDENDWFNIVVWEFPTD